MRISQSGEVDMSMIPIKIKEEVDAIEIAMRVSRREETGDTLRKAVEHMETLLRTALRRTSHPMGGRASTSQFKNKGWSDINDRVREWREAINRCLDQFQRAERILSEDPLSERGTEQPCGTASKEALEETAHCLARLRKLRERTALAVALREARYARGLSRKEAASLLEISTDYLSLIHI